MGRLLLAFTAGIPNNGVEPLESVAAGSEVAEDLMLAVEIEGAAGLRWFGWLVWVGFEVGRREPESKFAAAIARPAAARDDDVDGEGERSWVLLGAGWLRAATSRRRQWGGLGGTRAWRGGGMAASASWVGQGIGRGQVARDRGEAEA